MGRHSASNDGDATSARPVAPRTGRPKPGRHQVNGDSDPAETVPSGAEPPPRKPRPVGLDVIEQAMNEGAVKGGGPAAAPADETVTIPAVTAEILTEPARKPASPVREQEASDETHPGATELVPDASSSAGADGSDAGSTAKAGSGASDLALLRANSALRARVMAAVLVPFLVYAGVLLVIDTRGLRTFLIWIWIPLVTAGVLAGLLLDAAHRPRTSPPTE
ncbi:MAG: hypothetical protein ABI345_08755 [Jatrophihabitans sp.]